jgi:hypothetical protein
MQSAFGILLFTVVGVAAVIGLLTFEGSRRSYDEIGKGLLSLRDGSDRPRTTVPAGSALARAEQEDELRQMLGARNAVRERAGRPLLDVEAELALLLAPAPVVDPALVSEVRDLVIARNARRARAGKAPLDVEAEVTRQLAEFG